jgi:hypothetical protein
MIPIRYDRVRWVITVLTLLFIILFALLRPTGGALILFALLLYLSLGALVSPPGMYVWLIKPTCPDCGGRVEWTVEQGRTNPYVESLVVHCTECDQRRVEFSFDPT